VVVDEASGVEVLPLAASPEDYFAPGYEPVQYEHGAYAEAGDNTEIGTSPLDAYHTDEQLASPYAYDNQGIPVVVEAEQTTRGPSMRAGRREIEEGLDEAEFFVTQGLYDDARTTLQELLEVYPNHPLVLERLDEVEQLAEVQGGYEVSDPSYALADKIAEEVENLNPLEGPPTGQIDVETVLAQFRQGVGRTVSIEDCDTHYDLGIAYKEMVLLDDAIAEFKIATMNPARQCIGETMIGLCYMEKGDVASALEHFKQGLQGPQRSEREELGLYFEMGNAYESVGDLSEALYFFQKVDKRDPSFRNVRQRVVRLQGAMHGVPEGSRGPRREELDRSFDEYLKE
jgi:tetratricopeptide (TPR) repeat protein